MRRIELRLERFHPRSVDESAWRKKQIRVDSTANGNRFDLAMDIGASGGTTHIFAPSAKTIQTVRAALEQAFDTLPNFSSPPVPK